MTALIIPVNTKIDIQSEGYEASAATADVRRYSPARRYGLGIAFLLLGVGGGAALIIIPVLHLCTTWALPLIGIVACAITIKTAFRMTDIKGPCPACAVEIRLVGGTSERLEVSCPKCFKPLVVEAPAVDA